MVGYNAASSEPFELFNPWGTDSSGWCPGETKRSMACSRRTQRLSRRTSSAVHRHRVINANDLAAPADGLTGLAALTDGYPRRGRFTPTGTAPAGSAVDKETATVHANGSYGTATGYTRPARERRRASTCGSPATLAMVTTQRRSVSGPGGTDGGRHHRPHAHKDREL